MNMSVFESVCESVSVRGCIHVSAYACVCACIHVFEYM